MLHNNVSGFTEAKTSPVRLGTLPVNCCEPGAKTMIRRERDIRVQSSSVCAGQVRTPLLAPLGLENTGKNYNRSST